MPQKSIQTTLKDAILTPKKVVGACIFMTKMAIFVLKESKNFKDGSTSFS